MRRSLILLAVLLLAGVGSLGALHRTLTDSADDVAFEETAYRGSLADAEGLSVNFAAEENRQLFWESGIEAGKDPETAFRFSPKRISPEPYQAKALIDFYLQTGFGSSTTGSFEVTEEEFGWMTPMIRRASELAEPGSSYTLTARVSDYTDTYVPEIRLQYGDEQGLMTDMRSWHSDNGAHALPPEWEILNILQAAFPFPVGAEDTLTVTATKDPAGNFNELNVNSGEGCAAVGSWSAGTEDTLWFIVDARGGDDALLDYSATPNGYGIYRLDCSKEILSAEDLSFLCPLRADMEIQGLMLDGTEEQLLLETEEGDQAYLRVLDPEDGHERQCIPLGKAEENSWRYLYPQDDLLLCTRSDGAYRFWQKDGDGTFLERLAGTLPAAPRLENFPWRIQRIAYDGERLAMLAPGGEEHRYECRFTLAAADKDGVFYAGEYRSGLEDAQGGPNWNRIRLDHDKLRLAWR